MNATQAENLRILIRHMETNVTRKLYMDEYTDVCGTPACAMGEACICPELKHLDLPIPKHASRVRHGPMFVGASDTNNDRLFGTSECNAWKCAGITPQEWALEARKVLSENGYSMDEAKPIPSVAERLGAIYAGAKDLQLSEAPETYTVEPTIFPRILGPL